MPVEVTRQLNLIVHIELASGATGHVHAAPVSRQVFEDHFLVMTKTLTALYQEGLGSTTGPGVAYLMLKRTASNMGIWDEVNARLIAEIHRLANVAMPAADGRGWSLTPLHDVIRDSLIDEEQLGELNNALVFFILASAVQKRSQRPSTIENMCGIWETSTTRSALTEWIASLPTSTGTETSKAAQTQGFSGIS